MPTYSYACTECDNRFDVVQSFTDDTLTVCPKCSGRLRKLFNSVGVVFKGSGFYRNNSRGSTTSTDKPAEPKTDSKPSEPKKSATDAKPSSATATKAAATS